MKVDIKQKNLEVKYFKTAAGLLKVSLVNNEIIAAVFIEDIENIELAKLDINKIALNGTEFQIKVWQALCNIPSGKTCSYQDIANLIGDKKASRAVANAIANNKIAYFVPCHRVVCKDGSLGGYRWGIDKKERIIKRRKRYLVRN